jgi:hypothetical protein
MLTVKGGEEPNYTTTARKPGPRYIIQYYLLSSERAKGGLFVLEHLHMITTSAAYHFVTKTEQRMTYFHIDKIAKRQAVTYRK